MSDLNSNYTVAINLVQIFLQFSIITTLFKRKVHWLITLVSSAIMSVMIFDSLLLMIALFLVCITFYYSLLARMHIKQTILAAAMQLFLSLFIGNTFNLAFRVITPETNHYYMRITIILAFSIIFILIKWTGFAAINLTHNKIIFTLSLTLLLVALGSALSDYLFVQEEISRNIVILNAIGIFTIQATVVYIVFVLNKFTSEVEQAELQKQHTETLEKALDDREEFQSDYRNIMNTLNSLSEADDFNGLKTFINKRTNKLHHDNNVIKINRKIKDTMPYIYETLLAKANFAAKNGISFRVDVTAKIFELKTFSDIQLSRMIGILLNSAMKYAMLSAQKHATIEISNHAIEKIKIVIKTSVDKPVDTSKLLKRGFSFKKENSGLDEVEMIVSDMRAEGMYVEFNMRCTHDTLTFELLV